VACYIVGSVDCKTMLYMKGVLEMSNISLYLPKVKDDTRKLTELFLVFLEIGAFTLGGGFAMIPLIQKELVEKKHWVEEEEFLDEIAIAQSVPGAIAVNTAAITGHKVRGWPGAFAATLGVMIPSFSIIILVALFLNNFASLAITQAIFRAIRPVVVALITYSAYKCWNTISISRFNITIEVVSLLSLLVLNAPPAIVILVAILFGIIRKVKIHGNTN